MARACVIAAGGESVGLSRHVGWHLVDDAGRMHFIILGADTPAMRMLARLRRDGKYLYIAANIAKPVASARCAFWVCRGGWVF